jgi:hypothetical protein
MPHLMPHTAAPCGRHQNSQRCAPSAVLAQRFRMLFRLRADAAVADAFSICLFIMHRAPSVTPAIFSMAAIFIISIDIISYFSLRLRPYASPPPADFERHLC